MMSRPPKCADISETTRSIATRSLTSSVHPFAVPPLAAISSTTALTPSALTSVTATLAPSAANTRAVARPMPLAAPVTSAVNPFTERLSSLNSGMDVSPVDLQPIDMACMHPRARWDRVKSHRALDFLMEHDFFGKPASTFPDHALRPVKQDGKGMEMNELDFSGRQVLVVGGSSGIGNGIAQAFRTRGAHVAVCGTRARASDYSPDEGSRLDGLDYFQLNVSDAGAIEKFNPPLAKLDVLVLAQGAVVYRRGEFQMDGFRAVVEVNLMSLMACATKFHPLLRQARGALIIVSSTAAYHSTMGNPAYNASKTGAVGLTRTLGEAWAEDGIRVNGIAPGLVDTKMTKVTTENPKRLEGALSQIPLKRLGTPEDMAGAALFLASPLSSYIIGQTIVVDGGLIF